MSIKRIDNNHPDYIIYADGSATLGSKDCNFAVVITQWPPNTPATIDNIKEQRRIFTCSFEEGLAALSTALHWTKDNNTTIGKPVLVCTDSKFLYQGLLGWNVCANGFQILLNAIKYTSSPSVPQDTWLEQQSRLQNYHLQLISQLHFQMYGMP